VDVVCTIEDHVLYNGFGCAVMEHLHSQMINTPVVRIGWPINSSNTAPSNPTEKARYHRRRARGKSASAPSQKIRAQAICGLKKRRAPSFPKAPS